MKNSDHRDFAGGSLCASSGHSLSTTARIRTMAGMLKEAEHAAQILGMQLQFVAAASPDDIESAFSLITKNRADALSVFPSPILFAEHRRIASIAADKKLPAIYAAREGVEAGGLMSYGANLPDRWCLLLIARDRGAAYS